MNEITLSSRHRSRNSSPVTVTEAHHNIGYLRGSGKEIFVSLKPICQSEGRNSGFKCRNICLSMKNWQYIKDHSFEAGPCISNVSFKWVKNDKYYPYNIRVKLNNSHLLNNSMFVGLVCTHIYGFKQGLTLFPPNYSIWIFIHLKLCLQVIENYSDLIK